MSVCNNITEFTMQNMPEVTATKTFERNVLSLLVRCFFGLADVEAIPRPPGVTMILKYEQDLMVLRTSFTGLT